MGTPEAMPCKALLAKVCVQLALSKTLYLLLYTKRNTFKLHLNKAMGKTVKNVILKNNWHQYITVKGSNKKASGE